MIGAGAKIAIDNLTRNGGNFNGIPPWMFFLSIAFGISITVLIFWFFE